MRYSPEALNAFVETVSAGSFSAAARRLHKSQSTVSTAIANLEDDLGVTLFDRSARHPVLTEQGQRVLIHVKEILAASERLDQLAVRLMDNVEPRLTFVLSDTFHPSALEALLKQFDQRYPDTEFECLIGEDEDVIDLLQKNRAHIGLIESRKHYPPDIGVARLSKQTQMAIYTAPSHPLALRERIRPEELNAVRELRLSTYLERDQTQMHGLILVCTKLFAVAQHGGSRIWLECTTVRIGGGVFAINKNWCRCQCPAGQNPFLST
ncbi:HTH-type transcriptional activator AllS [Hafnia alvei]|uniref:HTH-type transcriptional activator AllS n=1 Tax=Hafnia alvei TaxID=569 RepID=A0A377PFB7_HAFAL|nr:HTH-type transcriptional activator AllS [Hafnia alvei]